MAIARPERSRLEGQLRLPAFRDYLTGLPNMRGMAALINAAIEQARRQGRSVAVLILDVDGFTGINDALGNLGGDELLALIGSRLRTSTDGGFRVGRRGSDEFVVLVDELAGDRDGAVLELHQIAGRLKDALVRPFRVARSSFEVSASIGTSLFPSDALNYHELVDHADEALHVAKRHGAARIRVFEGRPPRSQVGLETSLRIRRALELDELELYFQPVIELARGHRLGGLEALLRWRDPDRGLLTPDRFLVHIEHSPVLELIGEWVLTRLCRQLAQWKDRGFSPHISFNIPARQLEQPDFAEFAIATARHYGADPSRLALEIVESSPVELEDIRPNLRRLCQAGFGLSLDDYGTGYNSLARLRAMPFSLLKTDRQFMTGIPGDDQAEEMLRAVITMGDRLGLRVIVEGVETAAQEQAILALGARVAQGFYFGRPAPAEQIERRWGRAVSDALDLSRQR